MKLEHRIFRPSVKDGTPGWEYILPSSLLIGLICLPILAWTRALGEYGATLLFAGNLEGTTQTMPLAIYVGFEQGLGIALVLSMVLLAVSLALLAVLRRLELQSQQ